MIATCVCVCLCRYASIYIFYFLIAEVVDKKLHLAKFYNSATREEFPATPFILMQYVATRQLPLVGCWILVFTAGLCITGFLGYHLYQVAQGKICQGGCAGWAHVCLV